jgi:calcineurin-like phosphoesterase family protein
MQFFTSDTHFFHKNALKFRPFGSVEEMNERLIFHWNRRVKPDDDVYHLGDLSFAGVEPTFSVVSCLNGRKHWVPGNHDDKLRGKPSIAMLFDSIQDIKTIGVTDPDARDGVQQIVMCHFPMLSWRNMHRGAWMLHGHSHGSLHHPYEGMRLFDVGVDPNHFRPLSYAEIKEVLSLQKGHVCDQHRESHEAATA